MIFMIHHSSPFVRNMIADDVFAVLQIEQSVQSHPWTEKQIREALTHYQCTVLEQQQQVVGFCIIQQVLDEASLLLIAIAPSFQGLGLGEKLLSESLQQLQPEPMQIFLEVRISNQPAIALYEKLHFHQIDKRRNYYPTHNGQREDAVVMVKSNVQHFADLFSKA